MSYKNNHYVPRLVLRRFADKVSVYNIKTGELAENKRLEKVFALSELYSEEVEKELAEKIESPFALILNNKILSSKVGDNIEITRKELNIIKKFLLVSQMRVFVEEGKFSILEKGLTQAMKKMGIEFPFEEREISETVEQRWLRNIKVVVECQDLSKIQEHELCTYEIYRWAQIYNAGYMAIWDGKNSGEDFIITDIGMTSEVEPSYVKIGLETDKKNYLMKRILEETNLLVKQNLLNLLYAQVNFHENYYMFSISKNRMIVIINPFFRMYDKKEKLGVPNIWPTEIQDRKLFEKNKSERLPIIMGKQVLKENDKFWYKICQMNWEDVVWVNMLMLDRIDTLLGFADLEKISDSIYNYIEWHKERNIVAPRDYQSLLKIIKERGIIDE